VDPISAREGFIIYRVFRSLVHTLLKLELINIRMRAFLLCAGIRGVTALTACDREAGGLNILHNLPRVDLKFRSTTNDLGELDPLLEVCDDETICSASWIKDFQFSIQGDVTYSNGWEQYLQSLVTYSTVGIFFMILGLIVSVGACVLLHKRPILTDYSRRQVSCTYFGILVLIVLSFSFAMVSIIKGNGTMLKAQYAIIDSPDAFADLVKTTTSPVDHFAFGLIDKSSAIVERVVKTVNDTIDIEMIHKSFICTGVVIRNITDPGLMDVFVSFVDILHHQIQNVTSVYSLVDPINATITAISSEINSTESNLLDFETVVDQVNTTEIRNQVSAAETLLSPFNQQLDTVQRDLQDLVYLRERVSTTEAAIQSLTAQSGGYTTAELDSFRQSYASLKQLTQNMEDESVVKTNLLSLNTSVTELKTELMYIQNLLVDLQTKLDSLPSTEVLSTNIRNVLGFMEQLYAMEFSNFTSLVSQIPSTSLVVDQINQVLSLHSYMECALNISDVPGRVNDELVELPPSLANINVDLEFLRSSFTNVTNELRVALATIENLQETFNGTLLTDIEEHQSRFEGATSEVRVIQIQLENTLDSIIGINSSTWDLASPLEKVESALQALNGNMTIESLDPIDLAADKRQLFLTFATSASSAVLDAKINATYGGYSDLTCQPSGLTRCYEYSTGTYTACMNPETCEYPFEELVLLQTVLIELGDAIDQVKPDLETVFVPSLQLASENVGSVDFSCCTNLTELTEFKTQLIDARNQVTESRQEVQQLQNVLLELKLEFDIAIPNIQSFNSTLNDIPGYLAEFAVGKETYASVYQVLELETRLHDLIAVKLASIRPNLKFDWMMDSLATRGFRQTSADILSSINVIIEAIDPAAAIDVDRVLNSSDSIFGMINTLHDTAAFEKGSPYFLKQVLAPQNHGNKSYEVPAYDGYVQDNSLILYEDGSVCVTDECLKNAIDYYSEAPVSSYTPIPLNISRHTLFGVLFTIPMIVCALGILTLFNSRAGYGIVIMSALMMPVLFIVVGSAIFPVLLGVSDVCAGIESTIYTSLVNVHPVLCDQLGSTFNQMDGLCYTQVDLGSNITQNVEFDLPEIFKSVTMQCSGSSVANSVERTAGEPIARLFKLTDQGPVAVKAVVNLINSQLRAMGIFVRQLLQDDISASEGDIEILVNTFIAELQSTTDCSALSSSYDSMKQAICCDLGSSLYWSIVPWYLIAFLLLFCGVPCGVLATSRLHDTDTSRELFVETLTCGLVLASEPVYEYEDDEEDRAIALVIQNMRASKDRRSSPESRVSSVRALDAYGDYFDRNSVSRSIVRSSVSRSSKGTVSRVTSVPISDDDADTII